MLLQYSYCYYYVFIVLFIIMLVFRILVLLSGSRTSSTKDPRI